MAPAIDLLEAAVATPLERLSPGSCADPHIRFAGGILDAEGSAHPASRLTRRGIALQIPSYAGSHRTKRPGRWIYGGIWFEQYGHFLLETLARAWYLADAPGPVVFHRPPDRSGGPVATTMCLWQEELITALLGTPSRVHFLTLPTEFEELVVPDPGCVVGERCTVAQAAALATIGDRLTAAAPTAAANTRKLWLSRSALTRGRVVGEREFETELAAAGFEVIHPETMPLPAQVRALDEARLVAGFTGSAFHTALLAGRRRAELIHFARFTAANHDTFAQCAAAAGYPSRFHDCFVEYVADASPQRSQIAAARDVRQDFATVRRILHDLGAC
jgi:hypothetical protein